MLLPYQRLLLPLRPPLDLFLSSYGFPHVIEALGVHETNGAAGECVAMRIPAVLMLQKPPLAVVGHACVVASIRAFQNVNPVVFLHEQMVYLRTP